jgi:MFS transporter, OFA family, oxalate/formate antiporter
VIFGMVGVVALLGLKAPPPTDDATQGGVFTPTATMLKTPIFWLMFVTMSLMSMSGLMVTSQMATYGADFGIT